MSAPFDPYYTWLGIPPAEQPADYYRLLGLRPFEENVDAIQSALDQRMHFLRTLQAGPRSALSQSLLNEIARVGACLLNRADKAEYDRNLRSELARRDAAQRAAIPAIPVLQPAPMVEPAAAVAASPVVFSPAARAPSPRRASGFDWQSQGGLVWMAAIGLPVVVLAGVGIVRWAGSSREPITSVPPDATQADVRAQGPSNSSRENAGPSEAGPIVPQSGPTPHSVTSPVATPSDSSNVEPPAPPQPGSSPMPDVPSPRFVAAQPVNLLQPADGRFRMLRGAIHHGAGPVRTDIKSTAFAVPVKWPEEYALEADVTRIAGKNSLCFGFLVQGRPLTAIVDGFDSQRSGLARIGDFEIFAPKSPYVTNGALLTNGVQSKVRIEVTRASVALVVDNKPISRWNIDPVLPIRAAQGMSWLEKEAVCVYTWDASYQFQRLELVPLTTDE